MIDKKILRCTVRQSVRMIVEGERACFSSDVCSALENLPQFQSADVVLAFSSLPDEVDISSIVEKWRFRKRIVLPVVDGEELRLRELCENTVMQVGAFGILEPVGIDFTDYDKIDLAIVPGVAFDRRGGRLGRGKGYYDRLLPKVPAVKVGVCFPCQVVDIVPTNEWDVRMDAVICDNKKY